MRIRQVEATDKAQWQALWAGYQAFYGYPDRPQGFFDVAFGRLMSGQASDFRGLVADDGGRLLGLTH